MSDTPDPTDLPGTPDSESKDPEAPQGPTPIAPADPGEPLPADPAKPLFADPTEPLPADAPTETEDEEEDGPLPGPPPIRFGSDEKPTETDGGHEPPSKKGLSALLLGGLGCGCLLLLIAMVVGIILFLQYQKAEEERNAEIARSVEMTSKALAKLQFYKTNHAANADQPNLIIEANSLVRSSIEVHESNEALALIALTQVWANRWHLMSTDDYDGRRWTQDEAFTKSTLEATDRPAAYLARALVLAYGCHLQGNPNPSNNTCSQAESAFSAARTNMGGAPGWLRFELVWMEADYWNKMANYAYSKRKRDMAKRYWARVRDVCNSPIESMDSAPVNDEELMEMCTIATGALMEYDSWLRWARLMRADDIRDHRRTRSGTLKTVFRSAMPKCRSPRLKLRNVRGYKNYPRIDPYKNDAHPFCAKAGLIAMGCAYHAQDFNNWRYQTSQHSKAWSLLDRAVSNNPYSGSCYLDK